jgi:hypothetical protein
MRRKVPATPLGSAGPHPDPDVWATTLPPPAAPVADTPTNDTPQSDSVPVTASNQPVIESGPSSATTPGTPPATSDAGSVTPSAIHTELSRAITQQRLRTDRGKLEFLGAMFRARPRFSTCALAVGFEVLFGSASASATQIGKRLNRSKSEVLRAVAELRHWRCFIITPGEPGRGGRRNHYTPNPDWFTGGPQTSESRNDIATPGNVAEPALNSDPQAYDHDRHDHGREDMEFKMRMERQMRVLQSTSKNVRTIPPRANPFLQQLAADKKEGDQR